MSLVMPPIRSRLGGSDCETATCSKIALFMEWADGSMPLFIKPMQVSSAFPHPFLLDEFLFSALPISGSFGVLRRGPVRHGRRLILTGIFILL